MADISETLTSGRDVAAPTSWQGNNLKAAELKVTFAPPVLEALGDIAAIARMSRHFDPGIAEKVHEWSLEAVMNFMREYWRGFVASE